MDPRYPIGEHDPVETLAAELPAKIITGIAVAPANLRATVRGLGDAQLDTCYREGGWTVRQVVHHLADSHQIFSIRVRLALTGENPTAKTWNQPKWGELLDAKFAPVEPSLALLESVHERLVNLCRSLSEKDFARTLQQKELGVLTLDGLLHRCEWHARHHTAQIAELCKTFCKARDW